MAMFSKVRWLWFRFRELIVYGMIGCTGAGMDFVIFWFLTNKVGVHYQLANVISVTFGITNNFFLNAFFNFRTTDFLFRRFVKFFSVGMLGWGLSAGLLWLFISQFGWVEVFAKLCTIFFVTVIQFLLNKAITFRKVSHV